MRGAKENTRRTGYDWRAGVPRRPSLVTFALSVPELAPLSAPVHPFVDRSSQPGSLARGEEGKSRDSLLPVGFFQEFFI
jgi:hypothetical protein